MCAEVLSLISDHSFHGSHHRDKRPEATTTKKSFIVGVPDTNFVPVFLFHVEV